MIVFIIFVLIVVFLIHVKNKNKKLEESSQTYNNIIDSSTYNEIPHPQDNIKKTTYFFSLKGTDFNDRNQVIQKVVKNYVKDGLIWGKYDELTSREIKEIFPTEDDPVWEISSLETINVILKREPNNRSDSNAISVHLTTGELIGYIDKPDIEVLNDISNRILTTKAHIKGGKFKYGLWRRENYNW